MDEYGIEDISDIDKAWVALKRIVKLINGGDNYCYKRRYLRRYKGSMTNGVDYWMMVEVVGEDSEAEVSAVAATDLYKRMQVFWNDNGFLLSYREWDDEMASFDDMRCFHVSDSLFYPCETIVSRY